MTIGQVYEKSLHSLRKSALVFMQQFRLSINRKQLLRSVSKYKKIS